MPLKKSLVFILLLLTILYLHTAVSKILSFQDFTFDMNNQPFPDSWTPFLIYALPATEIAIVIAFFFGRTRLLGLYLSLLLMSLFTVYTALVLLHVFKYVPCSCGGIIRQLTWPQHLILNVSCLMLNIKAIQIQNNRVKQAPVLAGSSTL